MARINKLSTELFSLGTYSVSLNNDNLYDWTIKIIRCVRRVHCILPFNPFAPGDFAEKRVMKLVEWFSGHCRAIKS